MEFQEKEFEIREIGLKLQNFFKREEILGLAKSSNFIKKERKLTADAFLKMCIGGVINEGHASSLTELCAELSGLGVELCTQSLNEQFKEESVNFLRSLFERLILIKLKEEESLKTLKEFTGIYVRDATLIELPDNLKDLYKGFGGGASSASLKLDCCVDLKSDFCEINFRDGTANDSSMNTGEIQTGGLYLSDLGYFKTDEFGRIGTQGGYYISRFKISTNVYLSPGKKAKPIDLQSIINSLKVNEFIDLSVYVGQKKRLKTRLVLQRVPREVADAKRKKLKSDRQNKQKNVSLKRLAFCDCNAYLTNLNEEWSGCEVAQLYRIRWQIEIIFKVWKSVLKLGKVHKMKPERFLCLMYGHLIWVVLNMKIFTFFKISFWNERKVEISELKAFKIMTVFKNILKEAIIKNCFELFYKFLITSQNALARLAKKQTRNKNLYPLFHIRIF